MLHPHVKSLIELDLSILYVAAHFVHILPGMKWMSPIEEYEAFSGMMLKQLNLRNEALNLNQFMTNFQSRSSVSFPEPIWPFVTERALVEKYVEGVPMTYFLRNGPTPLDSDLATMGLNAFLRMLILDNFCHADLHPVKPLRTFLFFFISTKWQVDFSRVGF